MSLKEPKIVVKHSRIEINNYEWDDCPSLQYYFSIKDPIYYTIKYKGIEYDEENKKLYVPRGVDIPWLERVFNTTAVMDTKADYAIRTEPTPIKYLTRNPVQLDALKFILGMDNYGFTTSKSQLGINLFTGKGKTFVAIASICYTGDRAIIITNSIEWLEQWKAKILEYTPINEKEIYMIKGTPSVDKILHRNPMDYKIFLASHGTLKSYGDKRGWNKVEDLFKYLQCGVKIFDEAHLYFENLAKIDFHSNTKRTLYLTATPERSNETENNIYKLYFKNIPSIDLFDEDNDPHTDYIAMFFNSHPSPYDVSGCKGAYGLDRNKYIAYVVKQPNFKMLCSILINMTLKFKGKILFFIGTNDALNTVKQHILSEFPFLENSIGVYTSIITENKTEQLHKKIILSTTKSAGTASDIKDLICTVNLAEPFKSNVLAKQTLGRTRVDKSLYIDLIDTGFFYTKNYYKSKKPTFSIYAKSCKEMIMSDEEIETMYAKVNNHYENHNVMCTRVFKS